MKKSNETEVLDLRKTQLQAYVQTIGPFIKVKERLFELVDVSVDGDLAMATFKTPRTSYHGIRCNDARVAGRPGAEVWSILGNGQPRKIASFAIHENRILSLC